MMRMLDILALLGMAIGVGLMLQPFFAAGFKIGFFLTLGATAVQIVTSHLIKS